MESEKQNSLRFPHLYIVEASAGAGKTYALAKRYVSLLITPSLKPEEIPLSSILAITFTNKAAIEMKDRILEFFKRIALDSFSSLEEKRGFIASLGIDEASSRTKSFRVIDTILRNYNFFQVQTIDSFINSILSGCAFKLALSSNFKTKRNYRDYLAYSLDVILDRAAGDSHIKEIFRSFLGQYLYLQNKASWFPKQDILDLVISLFAQQNKYPGEFARSSIEAKDIVARKKDMITGIVRLRAMLPEGAHKGFLKNLDTFLERHKEGFQVDDLSAYFGRDNLALNKGVVASKELLVCWDKIKTQAQGLCEHEAVSLYNYYIEIFSLIWDDLVRITSREDIMFLEALNKQARALFTEKGLSIPELYYRLACRFKHFLFDEFQDTSVLQWENIFPMVEEALSGDGSIFYVGDKKQAIYRFRAGETSLFSSVKAHFQGLDCIEEELSVNYRSQKEIVAFNTMLFSPQNLTRFLNQIEASKKNAMDFGACDSNRVQEAFRSSAQRPLEGKERGYVSVELLECGSREEKERLLKERVIPLAQELTARFLPHDIAFLVRRNDEVELLSSWLLEAGFPVESEKTLDIRQHSCIKELVSLIKFLHSPIDNLSFASFILGDIFCQASGIEPCRIQELILRCASHKDASFYLYREFRVAFASVWEELLEEFFKSVGFVPLYELTVSIMNTFKVMERFSQYQGYFMRFLELIKEQEDEHGGIAAFLEFFETAEKEDLYVHVKDSHAIKIMTVHKSKGLEFPVVVIPFLEINVNVGPEIVMSDNERLTLIHFKKKYAEFSSSLRALGESEYLKAFIDELNNIYVAMTRAIEELYVFVPSRSQRGPNTAALLFPQGSCVCGKKAALGIITTKKETHTLEIPPSEYKDWIGLLKDEFIQEGTLRSRESLTRGEALHCILSLIGNLHALNRAPVIKVALEKAKATFPGIVNFPSIGSVITTLLAQEQFRPYFEVADGEVFTEQEVVDALGATKRIDRIIVTPKETVVIDYKSARDTAADYHAQMVEYVRIVREIYPLHMVRGVLIYLDDFSIEEVS